MARRIHTFEGRRTLAFVVILFSMQKLVAQSGPIQILPPVLSATHPTPLDFLSGTLVNSGASSMRIYLVAILKKGDNPIGDVTTAPFTVAPGPIVINSLNANTLLSPLQANDPNGPERDYINHTGTIPPGDYVLCVTAKRASDDVTVGDNQCPHFIVMDLNPPILVMPMNGDVVDVPFPTFIWTPPTPLQEPPTYRLRLVQLLSNQSPVAASGNNTAFHDVDGLFTNLYQYPVAARQIEDGRRYADHVRAPHDPIMEKNPKELTEQAWQFNQEKTLHVCK